MERELEEIQKAEQRLRGLRFSPTPRSLALAHLRLARSALTYAFELHQLDRALSELEKGQGPVDPRERCQLPPVEELRHALDAPGDGQWQRHHRYGWLKYRTVG